MKSRGGPDSTDVASRNVADGATSAAAAVPRAAHRVGDAWTQLSAPTVEPASFDPADLTGLPEPARRYLDHVIAPGTPLWRSVVVSMVGEIRLGRWWPFTATQVVNGSEGYIWAADVRVHGVPLTGFDRLSSGTGEMRWSLADLVPVMRAHGPDITRSAAGRLASEIVLCPTAFETAAWGVGSDPDTATATWGAGEDANTVSLHLDPTGRVRDLVIQRWGNPGKEPYGRYPFGVRIDSERVHDGVTLPERIRAGWWSGTARQDEGEFFRATITKAAFT